ncbi:hypothetical protein AYI69_g7840 [Smittium culicis]|uniref:Thermolabile hemolysin n=1 Tax=Smittium culicis TaxID=133412 RepID=A0A1R1XP75_9FUNG|nr:hypothetical protein AYI69_g7840 [Smittium culicis]
MKFLKVLGIEHMISACYDRKNKNITSPSCKDPRSFFFYDRVHPTTLIHAIQGAIIAEYVSTSNFEYTEELFLNAVKKYKVGIIYTNDKENMFVNKNITDYIQDNSHGIEYIKCNIDRIVEKKNIYLVLSTYM